MRAFRQVLAVCSCALILSATTTVTIESTLSSEIDDGGLVGSDGPLFQSFTPTTAYTLTSVTIVLFNTSEEADSVPRPAASAKHMGKAKRAAARAPKPANPATLPYTVATLYSDNSDSPGAALATSSTQVFDSQLTSSPEQYAFAFNYPLSANTRYWIGLSSPNGSIAFWAGSDSPTGTDFETEFFEFDSHIYPAAIEAYLMSVTGQVTSAPATTPAPSSWLLVAIGLAGLGAWMAFRRRESAV
jgi:MYXO-CTERM domain-containing protein